MDGARSLHAPDVLGPVAADHGGMLLTGSGHIDAERAFDRASRGRLRAALLRRLCRQPAPCLAIVDERRLPSGGRIGPGIREIPLAAINGTLEPSRAAQFDSGFRPARAVRTRWQRVWLAEQRGAVLPPISVVPVGDAYALRDGHHRVSVAVARGALTIDARVETT
jgi:hypothetical protein